MAPYPPSTSSSGSYNPSNCPAAETHGTPFRYCGVCGWIENPAVLQADRAGPTPPPEHHDTYGGHDALWLVTSCGQDDHPVWYSCATCGEKPRKPVVDNRPHSRACGIGQHAHGLMCHSNCPTCHGEKI
jgi:hypothetical protein